MPRPLPDLAPLLRSVRSCTLCAGSLPLGPRPVLQASAGARILIAGQAPGRKVHASGIPFDDVSGERLRDWMGVDRETFYDPGRIAIVPMGFCYPGTGRSGDLPPRPECAATWRKPLLDALPGIRLTIVLGAYALAWHVRRTPAPLSLTDAVQDWRRGAPGLWVLPHPSPRNNGWLKRHPWFVDELLPALRQQVADVLTG
ncbi:Uracil-DNA glycosylase superfamily [Paracidovorax avenae ATCC 19860]|uniref:Uracil-DNA glycosylase superfamily n=1 Tax=Paracidovorax avenae (strain ATCC 19860 / DSM 7227 / CCUG 15838 / JCM 20985 / LMG 2117 / NCPPB 1011) TaxID=643561 RepID=F0Q960_PARA1|nr:uracil-DNA glycosylase family protein [Paracidovorax avenae]ADX47190.1 Uracil-DNA glycosylase superfamily [Paracidovorax avenae ATCC 19860]